MCAVLVVLICALFSAHNSHALRWTVRSARSTVVSDERVAAVGGRVIIDCDLDARPDVSVTASPAGQSATSLQWFHDGRRVVVDARDDAGVVAPTSTRFSLLGFARLEISELRPSDAGLWYCRVASDLHSTTSITRAIRLKVYAAPEPPFILLDDSHVEQSGEIVSVSENSLLHVTCVSRRSSPAASVSWLVVTSGQPAVNVTRDSSEVTQLDPVQLLYSTRSQLTVNVTSQLAGARLKCVTSHQQLQVYQHESVVLHVLYDPRFSVIRHPPFGHPIIAGMRVNLTCTIDSSPQVTPVWVKDDERVLGMSEVNGTLVLNPVSLADAGWYKCSTLYKNTTASSYSFFLNVIEDPGSVESGFRTVETTVGALMSLSCQQSDNRDGSSPCWVRDTQSGASVASRGHSMHFDGATYDDTGVYTCKVPDVSDQEMEERAEARKFFVKVTGRPVISWLNVSGVLSLGEPVFVEARVCADPVPNRLVWTLGHSSISAGDSSQLLTASSLQDGGVTSCYHLTLHVHKLAEHLLGEVMLVVHSEQGTTARFVQLTSSQLGHVTAGSPGQKVMSVSAVIYCFILLVLLCWLVTEL